jgi:hypothetical protein
MLNSRTDNEISTELPPKSMQDLIIEAYNEKKAARTYLHTTSEIELKARTFLKEKETGLLMSGSIIGKNAEARQAELANATKDELLACEKAREQKMEAMLRMDLASMEVDRLQWLIRAEHNGYSGIICGSDSRGGA